MATQRPGKLESRKMAEVGGLLLDCMPMFFVQTTVEPLDARRFVESEKRTSICDEAYPLLLFQCTRVCETDRPNAREIRIVDDTLDEIRVEAGMCLRRGGANSRGRMLELETDENQRRNHRDRRGDLCNE